MNLAEIKDTYSRLHSSLQKGEIGHVIKELSSDKMAIPMSSLGDIRFSYNSLLDFYQEGVVDPQSQKILANIIERLYSILDEWRDRECCFRVGVPFLRYAPMSELEAGNNVSGSALIEKLLGDYSQALEYDVYGALDDIVGKIFDVIWVSRGDDDIVSLLSDGLKGKPIGGATMRMCDRQLFVSAFTMSLESSFSASYLSLLVDLCESADVLIRSRAMVGVLLTMSWHYKRLDYYSEIFTRLDLVLDVPQYHDEMVDSLKAILRGPQASAIMNTVANDIAPQIADKLNDKSMGGIAYVSADDWAEMTNVNPSLDKSMRQLDKWHGDGADIFYSTISHLKTFRFFSAKLSNWLLPFYKENTSVLNILPKFSEKIRDSFVEKILTTTTLCESDKYSVVFSLVSIPEENRESICSVYMCELDMEADMRSANEIDKKDMEFHRQVNSYAHDVYRLFTLCPHKEHLNNPYESFVALLQSNVLRKIFSDEEMCSVGDYCVEHGVIDYSTVIYRVLLIGHSDEVDIWKKMAFCLIKEEDYHTASEYLGVAEMMGDNKLWTMKKRAYCYSKLGDTKGELECLLKIAELRPDDMTTVEGIARCYENLSMYSEAQRYYFEAEYKQPTMTLKSSIARCYFLQEKFDLALAQINRLERKRCDDLIIEGHIYSINKQQGDAIKAYLSGAIQCKSEEEFIRRFEANLSVALKNGLTQEDKVLICEIVRKIKEEEK